MLLSLLLLLFAVVAVAFVAGAVVVAAHCDGLIEVGGGKLVTLMLAADAAIETEEAASEAAVAAKEAVGGTALPLLPDPPIVIAAWTAVDLLTHFSMWPFCFNVINLFLFVNKLECLSLSSPYTIALSL
jgi:hypothetical protein